MSSLVYITNCKICGQEFHHQGLASLLQTTPHKAAKVLTALAEHVMRNHPEQEAMVQANAMAVLGLCRIQYFDSQDLTALQLRDVQRYRLMLLLRKTHVPDHKIVDQITALELPDEYVERVTACVKLMRDIIEESGQFEPKLPAGMEQANGNGRVSV